MEQINNSMLEDAIRKINYTLINHIGYNLDGLNVCVVDLSSYGNRTPAGIYCRFKTIVVDPSVFNLTKFYSDYLKRYVYGSPIFHVLLHEISHYLIYSNQIDTKDYHDNEIFCDVLAEELNKTIHGELI